MGGISAGKDVFCECRNAIFVGSADRSVAAAESARGGL